MKKITIAFFMFLAACSGGQEQTFKTGEYKLVDSLNNIPTTVAFSEDGKFNGKIVNYLMGKYSIGKNNSITISDVASTMMIGPEEAMEAEQNFVQIMPKVKSYKMQGDYLVLITENGGELLFEPYKSPDNKNE